MPTPRRQTEVSARIVPVRATDEEIATLDRLARHLGLAGRGEVVRHAIARWLESDEGARAERLSRSRRPRVPG